MVLRIFTAKKKPEHKEEWKVLSLSEDVIGEWRETTAA